MILSLLVFADVQTRSGAQRAFPQVPVGSEPVEPPGETRHLADEYNRGRLERLALGEVR